VAILFELVHFGPRELTQSALGRTGELREMKKASGKLGSKPSTTHSDSFVDELNESQRLREKLHAVVHELKATLHSVEQNLQEARSSAQSQRKAKAAASGRKTTPHRSGGRGR
jgi:peptidoglycan hydrolase CwlO-like protein